MGYKSIQQNTPSLIVIDYKQANKLQNILAKHYCPNMVAEMINLDANKQGTHVSVYSQKTNTTVDLNKWIDEKEGSRIFIEYKEEGSCQSKTKKIEHDMYNCAEKVISVVDV